MTKQLTEFQQTFLDALRGGEYAQSKGRLQSDCGFCCMGVMCDVYTHLFSDSDLKWKEDYGDGGGMRFGVSQGLPPADVLKAIEFPEQWMCNPDSCISNIFLVNNGRRCITAGELNDEMGWSFARIADAFEHVFRTGELFQED